jgi:hypothetical protein
MSTSVRLMGRCADASLFKIRIGCEPDGAQTAFGVL